MDKQVASASTFISTKNLPYQPTPQCLRELVLDYLLHNAYVGTAQAFARESEILVHAHELGSDDILKEDQAHLINEEKAEFTKAHDIGSRRGETVPLSDDVDEDMEIGTETATFTTANDEMDAGMATEDDESEGLSNKTLELVRRRREIRDHILSGRVEAATQLLEKYFPSVLPGPENELLHTHAHKTAYKTKPISTQEKKRTLVPSTISSTGFKKTPHECLNYTSQLSTKPIHIALNLRILAFIEAARTKPLPYPKDPLRTSVFSSLSTSTSASASSSSLAPHDNGTATSSTISSNHSPIPYADSSDVHSAHQTALLHTAQRLYSTVESLQDTSDRDVYRQELSQVGGLLAYRVPEDSPMSFYLTQERREAVADQVNSAILFHINEPATSYIELYSRQTMAVWAVMREMDMKLPPANQYPLGRYPVALPRTGTLGRNVSDDMSSEITSSGRTAATGSSDGSARSEGVGTKGKIEKAGSELIPSFDFNLFLGF